MSAVVASAELRADILDLATILSDWAMEQDDPSRRHKIRRAAAALVALVEED